MALMALQITAYAEADADFDCSDCNKLSCAEKDGPYKGCKAHCQEKKSWKSCLAAHKKAKADAADKSEKVAAINEEADKDEAAATEGDHAEGDHAEKKHTKNAAAEYTHRE